MKDQRLACGCEHPWIKDRKVTMHTFDGTNGTEYHCPDHGWQRLAPVIDNKLGLQRGKQ